MAPDNLSPMLVLRRGVVVAVAGVLLVPPKRRFLVVGAAAVVVRGCLDPMSRCLRVGLVRTARAPPLL